MTHQIKSIEVDGEVLDVVDVSGVADVTHAADADSGGDAAAVADGMRFIILMIKSQYVDKCCKSS